MVWALTQLEGACCHNLEVRFESCYKWKEKKKKKEDEEEKCLEDWKQPLHKEL